MSTAKENLSTTSFAILGMLAIKPWSTYELAKSMDRSLARLWPRAQSLLFREPKKLVAKGLARAEKDRVGKRPRTIYSITGQGRAALKEWLAAPGRPPAIEFEQMLKVFFGEHLQKRDLLAHFQNMRKWADEEELLHAEIAGAYLGRAGRFPERLPILVLTGSFQAEFAELVGRWADWAAEIVREWPNDPKAAEPHWETLEALVRRARTKDVTREESGRREPGSRSRKR